MYVSMCPCVNMNAFICVTVHLCMVVYYAYVCTHFCIYIYVCVCFNVYDSIDICSCMHKCVHMFVYKYVHVRELTCVHICMEARS